MFVHEISIKTFRKIASFSLYMYAVKSACPAAWQNVSLTQSAAYLSQTWRLTSNCCLIYSDFRKFYQTYLSVQTTLLVISTLLLSAHCSYQRIALISTLLLSARCFYQHVALISTLLLSARCSYQHVALISTLLLCPFFRRRRFRF
jgi:hypothetical protein